MAATLMMLCAVAVLLAAGTVSAKTVPGKPGSLDNPPPPACHMDSETLDHGDRVSKTILDFDDRLVLYKYAAEDNTCYVRLMTAEEYAQRCKQIVIQEADLPQYTKNVSMRIVMDLDPARLPASITDSNNCLFAKLVEVAFDQDNPPSYTLDQGDRRRRLANCYRVVTTYHYYITPCPAGTPAGYTCYRLDHTHIDFYPCPTCTC